MEHSAPVRHFAQRRATSTPRVANDSNLVSKGDRVKHVTHGIGTVVNVCKDMVSVKFSSGVKDYNAKFAFENGFLTKV